MIAGGYNFFFKKAFDIKKRKVVLNGIAFKGGCSIGEIPEAFLAVGWANEVFRKNNFKKSIVTELGFGIMKLLTDRAFYYTSITSNHRSKYQPLLYLKINWNWYSK